MPFQNRRRRRLEEFEQSGLDGMVYLFTAGLSVDACRCHRAMSQSVLNGRKAAIGGNHHETQRVLTAVADDASQRHTRFK